MITVSKLFLINELFNWTKGSTGNRFLGSNRAQMNRPSPRPLQTAIEKEGVRKSREKTIVEPTPHTQGFKPSGIVT
jgi:hypothetical protein